ncbi:hypothetical protein EVAR_4348_1 [Eumeta japonica]|uniref:Uncharacterized protein n=1 Tax=Eumeta variegata TaxID=151549 RepID=A0A4C1VC56_EUMVA|nr:hypothetical protein EVAR_4348_1 [Eumeta japonica]
MRRSSLSFRTAPPAHNAPPSINRKVIRDGVYPRRDPHGRRPGDNTVQYLKCLYTCRRLKSDRYCRDTVAKPCVQAQWGVLQRFTTSSPSSVFERKLEMNVSVNIVHFLKLNLI